VRREKVVRRKLPYEQRKAVSVKENEATCGVCGVCGEWTANGDYFESGNRDRRRKITPCDNFICRVCQEEARQARQMREALEKHAQRAAD